MLLRRGGNVALATRSVRVTTTPLAGISWRDGVSLASGALVLRSGFLVVVPSPSVLVLSFKTFQVNLR
jgi:hypothetical protein